MDVKSQLNNNLSLPAIAAPMFLISGPKLVTECCKAGIVGTFPALNQRSTEGFQEWVQEIEGTLAESGNEVPYGVNLIVHHTNPRVEADLAVCVEEQVPIIITSLGAVPDLVKAVHSYGGLVFHDVINRRHAEKAMEAGVDGIICVAAGAGGHAGTLNPMPFIAEIKSFFDGYVILSGAMSRGRDVASAMQMGADFAYMGTRFINTTESSADDDYKQMIIDSGMMDVVYTAAVSGVDANFLRPSLESMGITKEMWEQKAKVDFGKELDAAQAEAKAWKTVWSAGQGVTTIADTQPTAELVGQLKGEFTEAIGEQAKLLDKFA